mgnify:CR=1 FL=1
MFPCPGVLALIAFEAAQGRVQPDVIVDLVETGTTLAENGLEVKEEILGISTMLVANRASYKLRCAVVGPLVDALRAVLAAPAA